MKRWTLILTGLAVLALGAVGGCNDSYDSTRLIVINNTGDTVLVEVDSRADGDIDVSASLPPGSQVDWVLSAGCTVVYVDGERTEICLEDAYDGVFEIADD